MESADVMEQKEETEKNASQPVRAGSFWRDASQLLILPAMLLYMESIFRLHVFGRVLGEGFWQFLASTVFLGFSAGALTMLLRGRARRLVCRVTAAGLGVFFSFYTIYYRYFRMIFSWRMAGQAKDVVEFWWDILVTAVRVWYMLAAFFVPLVLLCVLGRRLAPDDSRRRISLAVLGLLPALVPYGLLLASFRWEQDMKVQNGASYYYTYLQNSLDRSVMFFGMTNTARLEWKQMLFGAPEEEYRYQDVALPTVVSESDVSPSDTPAREYGEHVMDIDFKAASAATDSKKLRSMNQYFASVPPTKENPYTGMFEGKNLIFLSLEAFSYKVIDPEFTPTLYRMATEGFVFDNFYTSSWVGSTASGEYANLTGNAYATSNCLKLMAPTYQPFVLARQFGNLGYRTVAYHNNTYTYYNRHLSHPSLGYDFKAVGNGLQLEHYYWPKSDREMAEASADEYIGTGKPFHAYYMTVSGHTRYSVRDNTMSKIHYKDLPEKYSDYPEEVKAYLACQYEVELMLRVLVERLEQAGELENTVFAMAADHYPYGMEDASLAFLYGLDEKDVREQLPLYRNGFLLWSASMKEPVVVNCPCGNIDILPTLLNLFGMPYDSRLLLGRDILSEGDHTAILMINGNCSWISTQGTYDARLRKFTPAENCVLSADEQKQYVEAMNNQIKTKVYYSHQVLNLDYYRYLLKDR